MEFAFIAPVFITFVIAIANLGIIFFAHSGLTATVAEGARFASLSPRPTDQQIVARMNDRRYGMTPSAITGPTIVPGETSNGRRFLDISMSYRASLSFVFFNWPVHTMTEARRVYVYRREGEA
jgi:Flp pilus assembly protein TadG